MKKSAFIFFILTAALSARAEDTKGDEFKYPYSPISDRDPLFPLVSTKGEILIREEKGIGDIVLQGIIYSPGGSTVIINNELLNEGAIIGKYVIKKIEPNGIIIKGDKGEFFLKWEE